MVLPDSLTSVGTDPGLVDDVDDVGDVIAELEAVAKLTEKTSGGAT